MNKTVLDKITYLIGNSEVIEQMLNSPAKRPFAEDILDFLSDVSKILMQDTRSRHYSDVVTFAFWIRAASLNKMKNKYGFDDVNIHMGRGVAFHIAPSNVPVNFAYSLVTGLLTGNSNIVRVSSKDFPQVGIITEGIGRTLEKYQELKPYIALVQYGHDKNINDELSSIADIRITWGGDKTIEEIRESLLPPRSIEVTFADRYSLAVVDSDDYLSVSNKEQVALDFYNDTYFSDQNACTSPRIVVWTGSKKAEAKKLFWEKLHELVVQKYNYQDIQGVNKLTRSYLTAAGYEDVIEIPHEDNLIVRLSVGKVDNYLMNFMGDSGFFFEYDCDDVMELESFCDDKRCQTVGILGDCGWLRSLIQTGIKGIDRVVPIGHTMDFDLIWDGYDLVHTMTRTITVL